MGLPRQFNLRLLFAVLFLVPLISAAASNVGFSYQGRILRPSGDPVNSGTLTFTLKVMDSSNNCLLWSETQNVSMNNSSGLFSIVVGSGTRTDGGAHSFKQAFINAGTLSGLTCGTGNSYSPTANEDRLLVASFNDGGTNVSLNPVSMKAVPYAMQADQVSGYGILNLAKISGVGTATTLTPFQFDFLAALAAPATVGSSPCSVNYILKYNGTSWDCAVDATGGTPSDASYAAKGVVQLNTDAATSGLTVASGVLSVNAGTGANQVPKFDASGNLGAGVAPTSRLDVNGAITQRAIAAPGVSAANTGRIYYDSTNNHFYFSENGGAYNQLGVVTGALSSVTSVSNTAGSQLQIQGGATQSSAMDYLVLGNSTYTATSGNVRPVVISPTYNEASGTASNTDLLVNRTQTAVGSGAQLLLDLQVNGASKLSVSNAGYLTAANGAHYSGGVSSGFNGTSAYASSSTSVSMPSGSGGAFYATNYNPTDSYFTSSTLSTRNSAGNTQVGYIGAVSNSGAGAYTPSLVFGQQTGSSSYAESMRLDASGRLGIGTTTPSSPLHVVGDIRTTTHFIISTIGGLYNGTYGGGLNLGTGSATPISFSTGATERMRLDGTGNLGIGTTTPSSKLNVLGGVVVEDRTAATSSANVNSPSITLTGARWDGFSSSSDSWIISNQISTGANPVSSLLLGHTGSGTSAIWAMATDSGGGFLYQNLSSSVARYPGFSVENYMGSVNAGHPTVSLKNARGMGFTGFQTVVSSGDILGEINGNGYDGTAVSNAGAQIRFVAAENFSTTAHGSNILFQTAAVGTSATPSTKMMVAASGNVGIGTTTPAAKLDVAGEVKFGNTSSTCNASNEGQQRYNSTNKVMEFCNGTTWTSTSGIGVGQTWTNVTASRTWSTSYTNSTGKPIQVAIGVVNSSAADTTSTTVVVDGITVVSSGEHSNRRSSFSFIVPAGSSYSASYATNGGAVTISFWSELR